MIIVITITIIDVVTDIIVVAIVITADIFGGIRLYQFIVSVSDRAKSGGPRRFCELILRCCEIVRNLMPAARWNGFRVGIFVVPAVLFAMIPLSPRRIIFETGPVVIIVRKRRNALARRKRGIEMIVAVGDACRKRGNHR